MCQVKTFYSFFVNTELYYLHKLIIHFSCLSVYDRSLLAVLTIKLLDYHNGCPYC